MRGYARGSEAHRAAARRRLVKRANDADVGEAFLAGGLGLGVLQDAIGKMQQLGRELVALRVGDGAFLLALARDVMLETTGELVAGLDAQRALRTDDAVFRSVVGAEAHAEGREPLARKAQHAGRGFFNVAFLPGSHGERLDRLGAEDMARGVDAINADVVQRTAAALRLEADIGRLH